MRDPLTESLVEDEADEAGDWELSVLTNKSYTGAVFLTQNDAPTLRMLVNREPANLESLLRVTPACLKPGGRIAVISFHSGEDRLVKAAFREGCQAGIYDQASPEPTRASYAERGVNPRSRSAKLRWARRAW